MVEDLGGSNDVKSQGLVVYSVTHVCVERVNLFLGVFTENNREHPTPTTEYHYVLNTVSRSCRHGVHAHPETAELSERTSETYAYRFHLYVLASSWCAILNSAIRT